MLMDRFPRFSSPCNDEGDEGEEEISLPILPPARIPELISREDSLPIVIPEPVLHLYQHHREEEEPEVYIHLPPAIPVFHLGKPTLSSFEEEEEEGDEASLFPKEKVWQVSARLGVIPSLQPTMEYYAQQTDSLPPTMYIPDVIIPKPVSLPMKQYYETERFVDSEEEEEVVEEDKHVEAIPPTFYDDEQDDSVGYSQNVVEPSQFIGQEEETYVVEPTQGFEEKEQVEDLSPRIRHLRKRPTYLVRAPTHCTNEAELTFYSHDTTATVGTKRALPPIRFRTLPQLQDDDNDAAPLSSIFHRFATTAASPPATITSAAAKKKRAKYSTPMDDDEIVECDNETITTPQVAAKSRNKPHPHFTPPPPPPALRQASMLTFVTKRPNAKLVEDDAWIKPAAKKL